MDWNKYIRNSINKGLKKWNSKKKGHNVNAIDFIQFLGHSSIHEPFDDFLTAQSIKWRPKAGRDLDTMHFINGQGLVMTFEFDTAAVKKGTKIKSEGDYIFNHFTVQFIAEDKKHGKYVGQMLHDLALNDTRAAVERKLGAAPTRRLDWGDNYFLDGLVWTISFTSDAIEYVMLELPRDGLRKHGLCP